MLKIRNAYKELLALKDMKNKTITYTEYNNQINKYNKARVKGFKIIHKKNMFKIGLGLICLTIAIIPNGLMPLFLPLSFWFLGIGFKQLDEIKRKAKNKIRGLKG